MRFATARTTDGAQVFGVIEGDELVDVSHRLAEPSAMVSLDLREEVESAASGGARHLLSTLRLEPPIPRPSRILCIGVNYAEHAAESDRPAERGFPVVFTRFASTLVAHDQPIIRPSVSTSFDFEGELAVIIGRRARHVAVADAVGVIAGYSCLMDGTVRDWQRHSSQFGPGKNFDRSGSFGPWIVGVDELGDAGDLRLTTTVNGVQMQSASTSQLIHTIGDLIAYCSAFTELEPGDVIATGTPGGVGFARTPPVFLAPGDVVEVTIDGIGTLRNTVVDEMT